MHKLTVRRLVMHSVFTSTQLMMRRTLFTRQIMVDNSFDSKYLVYEAIASR
jgi:hypothetical protein